MAAQSDPGPGLTGRTVVVVGAGLAGLAAAMRLATLGVRPIVLEKRPFPGGRAYSFLDRETGAEVDNGQHVFLGVCTEYVAFLKEAGAWENVRLAQGLDVPVLRGRRVSRLRSGHLPGRAGMLAALLGFGHLSWADRARVAYGMVRAATEKRVHGGGPLEQMSFDKWLRWHGQNDRTIDRFWDLIVRAAMNDVSRWVSADAGLMLLQTALLGGSSDAAVGYAVSGLTTAVADIARRRIEALGGEVRTETQAARVEMDGGVARGVYTSNGEVVTGDACVLAVPFHALPGLVPPELTVNGGELHAVASLETSPIVALHIWYEGPVLADDYVAVLDSPIQWVFNVSSLHGEPDARPQHVVISLSGAQEWRDVPRKEIGRLFLAEMARLFPAASPEAATRALVIKSPDATFRPAPGTARFRPPQQTHVPGLFLAGDWTSTGWPSTMEGAVRSGNLAAKAVAESLNHVRRDSR